MGDDTDTWAIGESGNLGLGLTNTVVVTRRGLLDAIGTPELLGRWLTVSTPRRYHRLIPPSLPGQRTLFEETHRLRALLHRLFASVHDATPIESSTLFGINRVLGFASTSIDLAVVDGSMRLVTRPEGHKPASILVPIATAAADLAVGVVPSRLRQCGADRCVMWFVDTSKGGRRRWCSMSTCGNRSKAARFRERQSSDEGPRTR